MESESTYMYKTNCEACNSSDARAIYSDQGSHCFSCGDTIKGDKDTFKQSGQDMKKKEFEPSFIKYPESIRGISKKTLQKFTYGTSSGKHCTYYYDSEGSICAEKFRTKDKKFSWKGDAKSATLFGQNIWAPSEKIKLIIVEGELDALAVSHIQNDKYPVVSLPNGAASAVRDIKDNYDYVSKFKEVVLIFDMDEAGKKSAKEVQAMFKAGYCKIAKISEKDACAMLKAGKDKELVSSIFQAQAHVPEGIKNGSDLTELLDKVDNSLHYDYPSFLPNLTQNIRGLRLGDLTIMTAGSGSGKTSLLKQFEMHFHNTTDFNSGLIHLEEQSRDTIEGLVSVKLGRQLNLEDKANEDIKVREAWVELTESRDSDGNSRISILDTFGALDVEKLYDSIRYLANVENCKLVYLDHISMMIGGMDGKHDDRKSIDLVMTRLKELTQELNIHLFVISHLNNTTNGGAAFENGGTATVNNLKGSSSLKQLADNVILLTRDQMNEDPKQRNTVQVSLLKCRRTGRTGHTDKINYNQDTGIFTEVIEDMVEYKEDLSF